MADKFNIRLEGFEELERDLKKLEKDVAEKIVRAGARAGATRIRKAAQINLAPHRDTGLLSDSLKVNSRLDRARKSAVGTVRNTRDAFYGMFLEFGTINQPPIRWLTRAARDSADEVFRDVAARMRKRIAKMRK